MQYLCSFNVIVSRKSGFRPHHLTECISIKMTDDWLEAMDQGLYTGAMLSIMTCYKCMVALRQHYRGSKVTSQTVNSVNIAQF